MNDEEPFYLFDQQSLRYLIDVITSLKINLVALENGIDFNSPKIAAKLTKYTPETLLKEKLDIKINLGEFVTKSQMEAIVKGNLK